MFCGGLQLRRAAVAPVGILGCLVLAACNEPRHCSDTASCPREDAGAGVVSADGTDAPSAEDSGSDGPTSGSRDAAAGDDADNDQPPVGNLPVLSPPADTIASTDNELGDGGADGRGQDDRTGQVPAPEIPPNCGDGIVDDDEQCDDGAANVDGTAGLCNSSCSVSVCTDGMMQACSESGALGNCANGTQTCSSGVWGACTVQPELSDGCAAGDDANCDGMSTPSCECSPGNQRSCAAAGALGNCANGIQVCGEDGTFGECSITPEDADSCDVAGDDADCDGIPQGGCGCEEGEEQPCGPATDAGECSFGVSICLDGTFSECMGAILPGERDCSSSADNDCDGMPDNTEDDVCKCTVGAERECETHPGLDGNPPCQAGTQECVASSDGASSDWTTCEGSVGPQPADACTPGDDSDCNGTPNQGCTCVAGNTTTCEELYDSVGDCAEMTLTCSIAGSWPSEAAGCYVGGARCEEGCATGLWTVSLWGEACWGP